MRVQPKQAKGEIMRGLRFALFYNCHNSVLFAVSFRLAVESCRKYAFALLAKGPFVKS